MIYRPPTYQQHRPPLDRFRCVELSATLRLLSADFTELLTFQVSLYDASRSIRESVSGRYSVIPLFGISVLLILFMQYQRLTFSVRNESHSASNIVNRLSELFPMFLYHCSSHICMSCQQSWFFLPLPRKRL